jgi:hypothetical protein
MLFQVLRHLRCEKQVRVGLLVACKRDYVVSMVACPFRAN